MKIDDAELVWEVYTLPESSRVYWVEGTRIQKVYCLLPNPNKGIYETRNEAKRAVARYRRESEDYEYSHPGSSIKNTKKSIEHTINKTFENIHLDPAVKTIKIKKASISGLADYKKRNDNEN